MSLGNYFLKIPSGNQLQDLCNRLQVLKICIKTFSTTGNRLPVTVSEKIKRCNSSNGFQVFLKVITLLMVFLTRLEESIKARP